MNPIFKSLIASNSKIDLNYLTLEAVEDGTVQLRKVGNPTAITDLHYRYGGHGVWKTYTIDTVLPIKKGKVIQFWNNNTALSLSANDYVKFIFSGKIKAYGNCTSLLNFPNQISNRAFQNLFKDCTGLLTAPELPTLRLGGGCYAGMFSGCSSLINAPILSSMTLGQNCYQEMFRECISLTTPPELPATTLAANCYNTMFFGCTGLSSAPELPASALAVNCYSSMFYGTTISKAPILSATTIDIGCYAYMFQNNFYLTDIKIDATSLPNNALRNMCTNCTSLSGVEVNFTDWNDEGTATINWLNGCAESGVFIKPLALPEETGYGRIPTNWSIINK